MKKICTLLLLFSISQSVVATDEFYHPWAVGVSGGFGSTTWQGLIPAYTNQTEALALFTPVKTNEGGAVWGFFAEYECTPFFGLEADYMHYPKASIIFNEDSLFAYNHDGQVSIESRTDTAFLLGKVMLLFPRTHLRAYSGAGIAGVHRADILNTRWIASPIFSIGLSNVFTPRVSIELGAHYIAGRGEAEIEPALDYIPFLYAVYMKFAYRFSL